MLDSLTSSPWPMQRHSQRRRVVFWLVFPPLVLGSHLSLSNTGAEYAIGDTLLCSPVKRGSE